MSATKNLIKSILPDLNIREYIGNIYTNCSEDELKEKLKDYKVDKNDIPEFLVSSSRWKKYRYRKLDIYCIENIYFQLKISEKFGVYLHKLT